MNWSGGSRAVVALVAGVMAVSAFACLNRCELPTGCDGDLCCADSAASGDREQDSDGLHFESCCSPAPCIPLPGMGDVAVDMAVQDAWFVGDSQAPSVFVSVFFHPPAV